MILAFSLKISHSSNTPVKAEKETNVKNSIKAFMIHKPIELYINVYTW